MFHPSPATPTLVLRCPEAATDPNDGHLRVSCFGVVMLDQLAKLPKSCICGAALVVGEETSPRPTGPTPRSGEFDPGSRRALRGLLRVGAGTFAGVLTTRSEAL